MPRGALLAAADGWHVAALARASDGGPGSAYATGDPGARLDEFDAIVVRLVPPGSLDQIVFRIDALHLLADRGVVVVNHPRALERTIDKHWTSRLLHDAGLPTPRTVRDRAGR